MYSPKNGKQSFKEVFAYGCSSILHDSQKVEATQVSIDRRMDKQNMVCT